MGGIRRGDGRLAVITVTAAFGKLLPISPSATRSDNIAGSRELRIPAMQPDNAAIAIKLMLNGDLIGR